MYYGHLCDLHILFYWMPPNRHTEYLLVVSFYREENWGVENLGSDRAGINSKAHLFHYQLMLPPFPA